MTAALCFEAPPRPGLAFSTFVDAFSAEAWGSNLLPTNKGPSLNGSLQKTGVFIIWRRSHHLLCILGAAVLFETPKAKQTSYLDFGGSEMPGRKRATPFQRGPFLFRNSWNRLKIMGAASPPTTSASIKFTDTSNLNRGKFDDVGGLSSFELMSASYIPLHTVSATRTTGLLSTQRSIAFLLPIFLEAPVKHKSRPADLTRQNSPWPASPMFQTLMQKCTATYSGCQKSRT